MQTNKCDFCGRISEGTYYEIRLYSIMPYNVLGIHEICHPCLEGFKHWRDTWQPGTIKFVKPAASGQPEQQS